MNNENLEFRPQNLELKSPLAFARGRRQSKVLGMSIVEVVVAMGVLTLVGGALVTLVLQAVSAANSAKLRSMATKYAEEAVEIVRAVRGQQNNWSSFTGLCGSAGLGTDYCVTTNTALSCNGILDDYNDICAKVGTSPPGSYFTRKVNLTSEADRLGQLVAMNTTVTVSWKDQGKQREVVLRSRLTKWQ